jgi:hypothetical protein
MLETDRFSFAPQILSLYGDKKVIKPIFHDIPPTGYAEQFGYKHDEIEAAFVGGIEQPAVLWNSTTHDYKLQSK